jgi:hypothetical protein
MTKMPTPLMLMLPGKPETAVYSEAQLRQFRNDALEEAAKKCEAQLETGAHIRCAQAIRAMKETI